ncbi:MAG TPA: hypothetical protein VFW26_05370, partial [Gaiellales bacterium]|nr:hypothetical protein [Gaiellales bacterium]
MIVAQNVMAAADPAEWGGKDGDQVFLAQTDQLKGPGATVANWEAFLLAGQVNAQSGTPIIGVGVSP